MCYKKGKKNKEQKKTPVVYGKALVHDAYAGLKGEFTSKHKYIFSGNSLHANEIKGSFETADESSDYQTFIYVYPLYTYYGTYTSGTKGYTVTEYAQVFDLARGITYAPVKIASDNPPQSFKYPQGQVPTQKTGQVSQEKLYKYLRGLKCEKAK
jgi:hypothetical protein